MADETTPFVRAPWSSPWGCQRTLITAPTEEPLTLDEGKLRAGLDWPAGDPRDALMTDFIKAARTKVEQDTALALLTQTWDVEVHTLDCAVPLPSQTQPTQSITEVAGRLPGRFYRVESGKLRVEPAVWDLGPYTFRVVAGWPSVDALKAEAPGLYHAVGLLTAHYATLGRDLASVDAATEVPFGYEDAVAAYRLMWII